jgi:hypothetical protein
MTDRELMQMALAGLERISAIDRCFSQRESIRRLRDRLAQEDALDKMVAEQERLGLYEECIQISDKVKEDTVCKTHPDAPHGFDRNASLSEDRYVCECESWEPPEPYDQTALELCDVCGWKTVIPDEGCLNCKRLAQTEQEPVAWGIANTRPTEKNPLMMVMLDEPKPSHLVVPLYTAPPKREWVGLTTEEIDDLYKTEYFNIHYDLPRAVEALLKEKNT